MLHPSYTDLMQLVNSEVETGEAPVVNSRYSIVLATSKRARQLTDGVQPLVQAKCPKPLSVAIEELNSSKIRILSEEEAAEVEARKAAEAAKQEEESEELLSFDESEESDESGESEESHESGDSEESDESGDSEESHERSDSEGSDES